MSTRLFKIFVIKLLRKLCKSKKLQRSFLLYEDPTFNQDIGYWNTTFVRDMRSMFRGTTSSGYHPFNQDISNWDVGNVVDMDTMFVFASNFNQNLSCWDVSAVEVHYGSPTAFDAGTDSWDESNKPNFDSGGGC